MSVSYSEKLKDPRWQRLRLEIMQRDEFTCQECGSGTKTLTVHHRHYVYGCDPWDYEDDCLVTLCEGCHATTQEKLKDLRRLLGWLNLVDLAGVESAINRILNPPAGDTRGMTNQEIIKRLDGERDHGIAIALLQPLLAAGRLAWPIREHIEEQLKPGQIGKAQVKR